MLATLLSVLAVPAGAFEVTLGSQSLRDAVADGRALAQLGQGYPIGTYLLFGVDDALHIGEGNHTIEAVAVGTPYERLRYRAYLLAHQDRQLGADAAAQFSAHQRSLLEFLVFAHSRTEADRDFMMHFGGGTLDAGGGRLITADVTSSDPVSDSYFLTDGTVVKRWLGQVTYRFDLRDDAALAARAAPVTFTFTDDHGAAHHYALTLSRYR